MCLVCPFKMILPKGETDKMYLLFSQSAGLHSTLTSEDTGSRYEPACAELWYPCAETLVFPTER